MERFARTRRLGIASLLVSSLALGGCGRGAVVGSELPVKRVVVYRNGVAYFERAGDVDDAEVRFKMHEEEVGDFLATLAVMERGGSSVRSAAFPLKREEDDEKPKSKMTEAEKRGLRDVVLRLDGEKHALEVGYVARSPVWRPSYRLVVEPKGKATLQAWGIVENLSGEDWKDVELTLVAGAPLAFESQLGTPTIPPRPLVTDDGEVIAAVPKSETSLRQGGAGGAAKDAPAPPGAQAQARGNFGDPLAEEALDDVDESERREAAPKRAARPAPAADTRGLGTLGKGSGGGGSGAGAGRSASADAKKADYANPYGGKPVAPAAPPAPVYAGPSQPRDLRSLAAVAQEGGTTRYRLPVPVTVPDRSATMVMLLAQDVPGEAAFLFAADPGVPDSASHPFRVARFTNGTKGALERGPIAVFEKGAFLGQGMLDPLPMAATTTVPFALERGVGVVREVKWDELGERVAKIDNGTLWVERDRVVKTTYRVQSGLPDEAKVIVKHARQHGARLHQPPTGTEDNTAQLVALVPVKVPPRETKELLVDERSAQSRPEDWFSPVADAAFKAYAADARADKGVVAKLEAAWKVRAEIVAQRDARQKATAEEVQLRAQSEETRRNLRAIEKNKAADQLRQKLTQRLTEMSTRLDELTKRMVEIDTKLAELEVRFREAVRDVKVDAPLAPRA